MAILSCSRQYSHLPLRLQRKFVTSAGAAVSCLTGQGPSPQWQPDELTLGGLTWVPHLLCASELVGVGVGTMLGAPEGELLGMMWRACDRPWDGSSSPQESGKLGLMEALAGWSNCVPRGGLLLGCKWAWGKGGGRGLCDTSCSDSSKGPWRPSSQALHFTREGGSSLPQDQELEGGLVVLCDHVILGLPLFPSPFQGNSKLEEA